MSRGLGEHILDESEAPKLLGVISRGDRSPWGLRRLGTQGGGIWNVSSLSGSPPGTARGWVSGGREHIAFSPAEPVIVLRHRQLRTGQSSNSLQLWPSCRAGVSLPWASLSFPTGNLIVMARVTL